MNRKLVLFVILFLSVSCFASNLKTVDISRDGKTLAEVKVEIVDTPTARAKGLMFRKEMPANQGMWFIFDKDVLHPFWMENTFISLDIIFIDAQNKIVSIAKKTEPLSRDQISPKGPYRYVLEIIAGYSSEHKLKVGDVIHLK